MHWIVRKYAGMPLILHARRLAASFLRQTQDARAIQRERLRSQVSRHAESQFGRDHAFREIRSPADFRRRVPIRDYSGHEPYIARVREGDTRALFGPDTRVLMFAMTSGTTARPKTIPVTRESLNHYRVGWKIWGILAFDAHPSILKRGLKPILQLVSDWREQTTSGGLPCGAITGLTAAMQNPLIRSSYCMPPATMRIKDVEAKYYTALRLSIHRDVGSIMAANPSTLLGIAKLGDRMKDVLIRDLHDGTLDPRFSVPEPVRQALRHQIARRRPRVARRLEAMARERGSLLPRDYWPNIEFLGNWTGGTMGAYLRHYADYFGERPVRDIGLIASEGRFTIPIEDGTPGGVLDIRHHYFEFIPEENADQENPDTVEAADLIEGRNYFLLPTTAGGLYRYNIYDMVRCVGFQGQAPVLAFLNKGAHFSSLSGEKLSEFQVVEAVNTAASRLGLRPKAYLVLPIWGDPPSYCLLLESDDLPDPHADDLLSAAVDDQLGRVNLEYENRRQTLRLGPIVIRRLVPGSWADFQRQRLARSGGTAEQYKQPCLLPDVRAIEQFRFVQTVAMSSRS
jgi:hypothetical protein